MITHIEFRNVKDQDGTHPYEVILAADKRFIYECMDWIRKTFGNTEWLYLVEGYEPYKFCIKPTATPGQGLLIIRFNEEDKIVAFKLRFS